MLTYQDFIKESVSDDRKMKFVLYAIGQHQHSDIYETAKVAQDYDAMQNTTIVQYRKLLYTISGKAVPDNYSANFKLCSNFFNRFVTQQNQYLLGNGVDFGDDALKESFGTDFDTRLQELGRYAIVDGVAFGFWNYAGLETFRITEFVPFYDEEDGALKAGIRFWKLAQSKPLRATLYELDGYTDYMWQSDEGTIIKPKQPYIITSTGVSEEGTIYDGENYPSFPIVPLWGSPLKQSAIIGIRSQIDAYDLIKSGFANDLDDASQIYWTLENAGGMDEVDLAKFVSQMRRVKAAVVGDDSGARAESHTMEVPYAGRSALLDRLRFDMYEDFMALDTKVISGGAVTATQIKAAYEPLSNKADMYEYCILDFFDRLFVVRGIEVVPQITFTRSAIANVQDEIQTILSAAQYLGQDYVTAKILTLLGDADKIEDVLAEMSSEEISLQDNLPSEFQEGENE